MGKDLDKSELVYWSTDYNDGEFKTLSIYCIQNNLRLVLILPLCQQYTPIINDCFNILGDDLLIYDEYFNFPIFNKTPGLFTNKGKILHTYKNFKEEKDQMVNIFHYTGTIDMILSIENILYSILLISL